MTQSTLSPTCPANPYRCPATSGCGAPSRSLAQERRCLPNSALGARRTRGRPRRSLRKGISADPLLHGNYLARHVGGDKQGLLAAVVVVRFCRRAAARSSPPSARARPVGTGRSSAPNPPSLLDVASTSTSSAHPHPVVPSVAVRSLPERAGGPGLRQHRGGETRTAALPRAPRCRRYDRRPRRTYPS